MFRQSPVQRQVLHQDVYQHLIEMISSWKRGWDLWKSLCNLWTTVLAPLLSWASRVKVSSICYCWSNIDHKLYNTHDKDNKNTLKRWGQPWRGRWQCRWYRTPSRGPLWACIVPSSNDWFTTNSADRKFVPQTGCTCIGDKNMLLTCLAKWEHWYMICESNGEFIANRFLKGSLGQTYGSFIIHDESGTVRTNTWIIFAYFCLVRCYTVILLYHIILNIMTSQFLFYAAHSSYLTRNGHWWSYKSVAAPS